MIEARAPKPESPPLIKYLYLAGPDVFLPDAVRIGKLKKALCRRCGFTPLFPLDGKHAPHAGETRDRAIYRENMRMIRQADAGIFNLTPFRGPSADAGTIFELGVMIALEKPVFGYTNTAVPMLKRIDGAHCTGGIWRDTHGFVIEDFDNADNLMIDAGLAHGMNALIRNDASGAIDDLQSFETCLRLAASRLGVRG